jgi:hypothetical protein
MADIGETIETIELEPLHAEPAPAEPAVAPAAPVVEPEPVPA